jgi:hypothetical protein
VKHLWRLSIAALALSGCQAIAGVEERAVDPIETGCTLPTMGDARIRFANLVPNEAPVDLCVRSTGGAFVRPMLRGGGSACPSGLNYAQASAKFAVPSGKIDVKVIAAGRTCSAPALSSIDGVTIASGSATTIVRMGNEKLGESLRAYPEATSAATSGRSKFRLINASPGSTPFDVGIATTPRLPSELKTPLFATPLAYAEATTAQSKPTLGTATPEGYIEVPGTQINLGAAPAGSARATIVTPLPGKELGRTVFLIGDPAKPYFPVRALTCEDFETENPLLTRCTPSALGTLSVDTFNAYLYGPFADDEEVRRPYVLDALAARDADLMCVTAISRKSDRDALIAKAKAAGTFAYAIASDSTLDTAASDPRDASGATPRPYEIAACGGTNDAAAVDAAVSCVTAKCSTTGTPDGLLKGGSDCISSACASQFIPLLAGDQNQKRCFNCLVISSLSDETHAETRATCTTDIRDYKAFKGQTTSMVLSRYPVSEVETFYLPSTSYQRVVHYAKVAIERDKTIDFFCGELTAAFGALVPYHGHYAPDVGQDAWFQEQLLQTKRVIEYVKRKSGTRPAIITGDWATSQAYTSPDGLTKIDDQNGAVLTLLDSTFVPALPPGFTPRCTECAAPANPYNGDLNIWQFRTYLANLPASAAVEAGLFFTDAVVPLPSGEKRPLSDRWGLEVRVLRP